MKKTKKKEPTRKVARKRKPRPPRATNEDFITDSTEMACPEASSGEAAAKKRNLGARIREARELRDLTLEDLSSRVGIPVATLERVESNRVLPPLGELIRLGKALEMKMGYFISSGVDRPMCVVLAESRPTVARRSKKASERYGYVYQSLASEKANRSMEPFLVTMSPTKFGEMSSHDGQEFLFVLEGKIRAKIGKEVAVLGPGDSIYYDSSEPHLVKCYGKEPAKIIAVIHAGEK